MTKPAILTVDDDPMVSAAITRDLRGRYGNDYRVVQATSAPQALTVLTRLALRDQPVALIVADQRMPEMTGIEFLAGAHELHPLAKRILLVERDYTTANPIVPAMMLGQIDYHLVKPWLPDHGLYPAVSEFLASWEDSDPEDLPPDLAAMARRTEVTG